MSRSLTPVLISPLIECLAGKLRSLIGADRAGQSPCTAHRKWLCTGISRSQEMNLHPLRVSPGHTMGHEARLMFFVHRAVLELFALRIGDLGGRRERLAVLGNRSAGCAYGVAGSLQRKLGRAGVDLFPGEAVVFRDT